VERASVISKGGRRMADQMATIRSRRTLAQRLLSGLLDPPVRRSGVVKGFGCRPVVTYPAVLRAGVGKPPRKEPAGAGGGSAVYGDLVGRRLASGMRGPGSAAAERR